MRGLCFNYKFRKKFTFLLLSALILCSVMPAVISKADEADLTLYIGTGLSGAGFYTNITNAINDINTDLYGNNIGVLKFILKSSIIEASSSPRMEFPLGKGITKIIVEADSSLGYVPFIQDSYGNNSCALYTNGIPIEWRGGSILSLSCGYKYSRGGASINPVGEITGGSVGSISMSGFTDGGITTYIIDGGQIDRIQTYSGDSVKGNLIVKTPLSISWLLYNIMGTNTNVEYNISLYDTLTIRDSIDYQITNIKLTPVNMTEGSTLVKFMGDYTTNENGNPVNIDPLSIFVKNWIEPVDMIYRVESPLVNRYYSWSYGASSPSPDPTIEPSSIPSVSPSPTIEPSSIPSLSPSPTIEPSSIPGLSPSPTIEPSSIPSVSPSPTIEPSGIPSPSPSVTVDPGYTPNPSPTSPPNPWITPRPSDNPSGVITPTPTHNQGSSGGVNNPDDYWGGSGNGDKKINISYMTGLNEIYTIKEGNMGILNVEVEFLGNVDITYSWYLWDKETDSFNLIQSGSQPDVLLTGLKEGDYKYYCEILCKDKNNNTSYVEQSDVISFDVVGSGSNSSNNNNFNFSDNITKDEYYYNNNGVVEKVIIEISSLDKLDKNDSVILDVLDREFKDKEIIPVHIEVKDENGNDISIPKDGDDIYIKYPVDNIDKDILESGDVKLVVINKDGTVTEIDYQILEEEGRNSIYFAYQDGNDYALVYSKVEGDKDSEINTAVSKPDNDSISKESDNEKDNNKDNNKDIDTSVIDDNNIKDITPKTGESLYTRKLSVLCWVSLAMGLYFIYEIGKENTTAGLMEYSKKIM